MLREWMTTSPTQAVWLALGKPTHTRSREPASCLCALCGAPCGGEGVPIGEAIGDAFSDHRDLAVWASPHCCSACVWAMQGSPPNTIRGWSILWRADGKAPPSREGCPWRESGVGAVHMSNKADLSAFIRALLEPPPCSWAMSLADSGKIHTLPFAAVNMPGAKHWAIRFERNDIRATVAEFRELHEHAAALYRVGFSKADILSGQPQPSAIYKNGIDAWREHGRALAPRAGSKLLELSLFFARKEDRNG